MNVCFRLVKGVGKKLPLSTGSFLIAAADGIDWDCPTWNILEHLVNKNITDIF